MLPFHTAVTPNYFKTNPPSPIFDEKGLKYGIHMTFEKRYEADEEVRLTRKTGDKFIVKPWEGGYVIYAHWAEQPCNYAADSELIENVHAAWDKCAEWERIHHPGKVIDSKDFTFSEDNPYLDDYGRAVGKALRMQELQRRGGWEAETHLVPSKFDRVKILTNPLNAIGTIEDIYPGLSDIKYQIWIHGTGRSGIYKKDEFEILPFDHSNSVNPEDSIWDRIKLQDNISDPFSKAKITAEYDSLKAGRPANKNIDQFIGYAEAGLKEVAVSTNNSIPFNRKNVIDWTYDLLHPEQFSAMTIWEPLTKFCCRLCGECAPAELLAEGKFPDRMAWLRRHYEEKHPGMWGSMSSFSMDNEYINIPEALMKSIEEEMLADDAYLIRADLAEKQGDMKSAELWRHIAAEECCGKGSHYKEFEARYNELAKSNAPQRRPMTELREFMARTKTSTPDYIRGVVEGNLFTEDEVQLFTGMKGQNPLGIKDEEWRQFMRANGGDFVKTGEFYQFVVKEPFTPPGIRPSKKDLVGPNPSYPGYVPGQQQFIPDSAEYMADTITKTGWRDKIDDAFQSAVERLHRS
jgi:hypothetical protein